MLLLAGLMLLLILFGSPFLEGCCGLIHDAVAGLA